MRGQQKFIDMRVFVPNANQCPKKALPQCHIQNEKEKKRQYNEKVLEIDQGRFIPPLYFPMEVLPCL